METLIGRGTSSVYMIKFSTGSILFSEELGALDNAGGGADLVAVMLLMVVVVAVAAAAAAAAVVVGCHTCSIVLLTK